MSYRSYSPTNKNHQPPTAPYNALRPNYVHRRNPSLRYRIRRRPRLPPRLRIPGRRDQARPRPGRLHPLHPADRATLKGDDTRMILMQDGENTILTFAGKQMTTEV